MSSLNPYLVYHSNCEEAFRFYKEVFLTADLHLTYYKDAPEDAKKFFPSALDENVLHATLKINENMVIMGNDHADPSAQSAKPLSIDFYLYVDIDSPKEAVRVFNELSVGGKVIMPIVETFWTPVYGILTDRFGINWKITSHQNNEG